MYYEKGKQYKKALKHYKNGYAKMDENGGDAEAYYQNIERVLNRQSNIVEQKEEDKLTRETEKEAEEEQRRVEKEREAEQRELDKETKKNNKAPRERRRRKG